jgi:hypothetical protein
MDIDQRNTLRAEAGLPKLEVEAEQARLTATRRDAAFEAYFLRRRDQHALSWSDPSRGWLGNAAIWATIRRRLRAEFDRLRGEI